MTDQCAILQNQRLSSPPVAAALCPTMDLVALTAKDASLSVYRCISWQHVHSITDPAHQPGFSKALAWSPCGKRIAAGTMDGRVCMYEVEQTSWDHNTLALLLDAHGRASPVSTLYWTRCGLPTSTLPEFLQIRHTALRPVLTQLPPEGMAYTYPPLEPPVPVPLADAAAQTTVELICVGQDNGNLTLVVDQSLPLGSLAVTPNQPVTSCALSLDWSLLATVSSGKEANLPMISLFDTSTIARRRAVLAEVASECACINLSVKHALQSAAIMKEHWDSAVKQVGVKMDELGKLLADYGSANTVQAELCAVFSAGALTPASLQFFQTVGNEQAMTKVYRVVDTACSLIETLSVRHLLPALEAAILAMASLKGKAAVGTIGVAWTVDDIIARASFLQNILLLVEQMRCVLGDGRAYLEALFRWFRKLSVDSASKDTPPIVLAPDEKARIGAVLQLVPLCDHELAWNPLLSMGLDRYFVNSEDIGALPGAAGVCDAFQLSTCCPACESKTASGIASSWTSFQTMWQAMLSHSGVVEMIQPALRILIAAPGEHVSCTVHAENSTRNGNVVVVVAYERGSAWACDVLRFCCSGDGVVTAEHARVMFPDDVTNVRSCNIYGHTPGSDKLANTPHLVLTIDKTSDIGDSLTHVMLLSYQDLKFKPVWKPDLSRCGLGVSRCVAAVRDEDWSFTDHNEDAPLPYTDLDVLALKTAASEAEFAKFAALGWLAGDVTMTTSGPRGLLAAVNSDGHIAVIDGEETVADDSDVSQMSVDGDSHTSG